jgi:hypothetical protein
MTALDPRRSRVRTLVVVGACAVIVAALAALVLVLMS